MCTPLVDANGRRPPPQATKYIIDRWSTAVNDQHGERQRGASGSVVSGSVAGGSVASGSVANGGRRPPQAAARRRQPSMCFLCTKGMCEC